MPASPLDIATLEKLLGLAANWRLSDAELIHCHEETAGDLRVIEGRIQPDDIPTTLLLPRHARPATLPGILYIHAHGGAYAIGKSELLAGRPALLNPPPGRVLAESGYAVICIDLPGFGERQSEGSESLLAKAALWNGRSLLADMLTDLHKALLVLAKVPEVDATRLASLGISMGGTLAYLHAALEPTLRCCAQLCVFADIAPLIAANAHDKHGVYMLIPGLLPNHDMGDIAGLVAPRPQLITTGEDDALTPEDAYRSALLRVQASYRKHDASEQLICTRYPHTGHNETADMRREVLGFLQTHLHD